jgi:hypothetical protein
MSRLNLIEQALVALSSGAFQKLAAAYLNAMGYGRINAIGSVVGADKVRKGTPDSLVSCDNGNYVFSEDTTQQTGLYSKLEDDLLKCLDEDSTGIPVDRIQEVVFCYTGRLDGEEEEKLRSISVSHGVALTACGPEQIALDLCYKYQGIALEHLGIPVDSGQVLLIDAFVEAHERRPLTPSLDTEFRFREQELAQAVEGLEQGDIVLISGPAGVGKTRLAVECCRRFVEANPDYCARAVFSHDLDLHADMRVYFSPPGKHLILIDDANRVVQFKYFVDLVIGQRDDQQIKVLATVRDYARDSVYSNAREWGEPCEVPLSQLDDQQIAQLVSGEYGILNHLYLERITRIAKGNPRIAMMAGKLATDANRLDSIQNVTALYDEYFASVSRDLAALGDPDVLRAAGIVAFLRFVDRTDDQMMSAIEEAFGIPSGEFWKAVRQLHQLEICDLYEGDLVRASNQVLADYLFYRAFFKDQSLDFSALLGHFFPRFRGRLTDVLYSVLDSFDANALIDQLRPDVTRTWSAHRASGDETVLLHLGEAFWFAMETEVLGWVAEQIEQLEVERTSRPTPPLTPDGHIRSPSILGILSRFAGAAEEDLRVALGLIYTYVGKRPLEVGKILYIVADRLGFTRSSYARGYAVQRAVEELLWQCAQHPAADLHAALYLAVANEYLRMRFHRMEASAPDRVHSIDFSLSPEPALLDLRKEIWAHVFELFKRANLRAGVLDLVLAYTTIWRASSVPAIVAADAETVLPFIRGHLSPDSYFDCLVANAYLDFLETHEVQFDAVMRDYFTNPTFATSLILLEDRQQLKHFDSKYQSYFAHYCKAIEEFVRDFGPAEYRRFLKQCATIYSDVRPRERAGELQRGIAIALRALFSQSPGLYAEVLDYYLGQGDPLELPPVNQTQLLVDGCGIDQAVSIVLRHDPPPPPVVPANRIPRLIGRVVTAARRLILSRSRVGRAGALGGRWLAGVMQCVRPGQATRAHERLLYSVYRGTPCNGLPNGLDFLVAYEPVSDSIVPRVVELLVARAAEAPKCGFPLAMMFESRTGLGGALPARFEKSLPLLSQAYFAGSAAYEHMDYNCDTFNRILDADPDFILHYVDWLVDPCRSPAGREDWRNWAFVWMRDDYVAVFTRAVDHVRSREDVSLWESPLPELFIVRDGTPDADTVVQRQDEVLQHLVGIHHSDLHYVRLLFHASAEFSPQRRKSLVAAFLDRNTRLDDFVKLQLEASSHGWWGSAVPVFEARVEFFQSLLPLVNSVELLGHRQYIQGYVQGLQSQIQEEKRSDFLNA